MGAVSTYSPKLAGLDWGGSNAALSSRAKRAQTSTFKAHTKIIWYIDQVSDKIAMTMHQRLRLATKYLKSKVAQNISVPVGRGPNRSIVRRSKAGEFPRMETTRLMKTLFTVTEKVNKNLSIGYVCTPIEYGVMLELGMGRPFLARTLYAEIPTIRRILLGPIK